MSDRVFDRDTLLDLTVNVIPLAILAIFFVGYIVVNPFGFDTVISAIQLAIIGLAGVLLAVLTYYSGKAVSKAESEEEESIEPAETTTADPATVEES